MDFVYILYLMLALLLFYYKQTQIN